MKKEIKRNIKVHIRRGDRVKVLTGKCKNEEGVVLRVFPKEYRAIVEGVNMVSRHVKPSSKNPQGTVIKKESGIHISNIMLIEPSTGQATRIGRKKNEFL